MTEAIRRLSEALNDRYQVERELGQGGMATVYLAVDLKHHRRVALKVLRPELARIIGSDRFSREIEIAAALNHPHILPLHDSGAVGDLLYYVMPYVEGESLRARLERDKIIPAEEARQILREVADALAYAHRHGVVHRDIKPDNILLSDGHALVADFGIAKAVSAAADGGRLTSTGMAVGTPGYMAPEQVVGDQHLDHRADIYSLGAVAYEMLAGREMFSGSPQSVVAAHLTEAPPPLLRLAPQCPPGLAALVMQCVEKEPSNRPATATDVAAELSKLSRPSGERATRRRRWPWLAGVTVVLGLLAGLWFTGRLGGRSLLAQGVLQSREPILLADVANHTRDSLLGLAFGEALRVDLTQGREVSVVSVPEVRATLALMGRSPDAVVDPTVAREISQRQGYKAIVTGDVASVGNGFVVSVELISAQSGKALAAFRETAKDSTRLIEAIGNVSRQLRRRIGESLQNVRTDQPLEQVTTTSLEGLRKYSQGVALTDTRADFARANDLLREAIALDSGFAMAWRKLGLNLSNVGETGAANAALGQAFIHRARLTELERYLTIGSYYTRVIQDHGKAIDAYQSVLDINPRDFRALNSMGIIYGELKDPGRSEGFYRQTIAADSSQWQAYFNLIATLIDQGKLTGADSILSRAVRIFPASPPLVFSAVNIHYAKGDWATARHVLDSLRATAGANRGLRGVAGEYRANLALLNGHLREADAMYQQAEADAGAVDFRGTALSRALASAWIDAWFRGNRERGIAKINAALKRWPLASIDAVDRPYLDLANDYAFLGRFQEARQMMAALENIDPSLRYDQEGRRQSTMGFLELAEGRPKIAITQVIQAIQGDPCPFCGFPTLGRAYEAQGEADSAIAVYQRYLATIDDDRLNVDATYLPWVYRRLGELYEKKGNKAAALEYYGRFVEVWRDADPDMQPLVKDIRQRLTALSPDVSNP